MTYKLLSVIIHCYNEENTICSLVESVVAADRVGLDIEIIVTDFKDSNELYSAIEGLSFQLGVNSTKTGDTLRDYKIYTSFFGTMLNTK